MAGGPAHPVARRGTTSSALAWSLEATSSYETRISCLLAPDLALYDGIAQPEDNYREQTGVARRERDGQWRRLTTTGPVLPARYVAFDGTRFFWEHALPDGSHELRAAQPSVAVESESTAGR